MTTSTMLLCISLLGTTAAEPQPADTQTDAPVIRPVNTKPAVPETTLASLKKQYATALKKLPREATIEEIVAAATRQASKNGERIARWQRTTRTSALLPTVRIVTDYDMERDESLDRYQDEPDRWGADTDNDFGIQLTVQWELEKLVFNPSELRAHKSKMDHEQQTRELVLFVTRAYYERKTLLITDLMSPDMDPVAFVERKIRIKELTAQIDALTDGLLSRTLRE